MKTIILAAIALSGIGCHTPGPSPDCSGATPGATCPAPAPTDACAAVCNKWALCDWATSPLKIKCPELCARNTPPSKSGWDTGCMLKPAVEGGPKTCAEADKCGY